MKVAYVFAMPRTASYKLAQMILPQLEAGTHGVDVVGMFFFDDNTFVLRKGDPIGERLAKVAKEKGILLMMCDMCALERNLAEGEPRWCAPDGTGRTGSSGNAWNLRSCAWRDAYTAASYTLEQSMATVIGPTPPGTGVTNEAFSTALAKSTSPTNRWPFLALGSGL